MIYKNFQSGRFYNEDCFDAMREIPDGVIDMIFCDLPYGTTQCKWDNILDFTKLWEAYWRITKPNAAIVLTAAQPFTANLIMSQINYFKYDWIWKKPKGTGHLNAKKMPMRDKEDICIFYKDQCTYNPQFEIGEPYKAKPGKSKRNGEDTYGEYKDVREDNEGKRYPKQILEFPIVERIKLHPTQKPVELVEYFIKTYTNENELVLDNTAGSGTTAIAAINTNRKWVCIENDKEYYDKALNRIENHK